ncbi:hydrogenase maturation protease [Nocardia bovistercoris]|uniref:Hydrogenase maturation protease n=1 Tax=Nocardia bovistercoris TaxID=2785916 RepID=A0A931IJP7_9NOCA|nr:hydrogenase maturation protease [Nocardia bovistercoris]MBH0780828.1 hydrogenase maturation protease [Nocardia bovistercoris]
MATGQLLVAGIGNIFLGDDGFGPEVLARLPHEYDERVCLRDYGIRGMHLAYDLLEPWRALILVDALPNRGAAGRVEVLRADPDTAEATGLDAHAMDPAAVFAGVRALGGTVPPTIVVGCQVACVEEGIGLSDRVAAAVDAATTAVADVLAELLAAAPEEV